MMKMLKIKIGTIASICIIAAMLLSCKSETKKEPMDSTQKALVTIQKWVENHSSDYPHYTPMEFGALTPRYKFNSRTHQILSSLEEEKTKDTPNWRLIDSLQLLLDENKTDLLGYTIVHRFTTKALNGEVSEEEKIFFLDTLYRMVTVLNADSWDLIMDKELFFNPETPDSNEQK